MLRVHHTFQQPRRQGDSQRSVSSAFGKRRDGAIARHSRQNKSSSAVLDRYNQRNQSRNSFREQDSIIVLDTNEPGIETLVGAPKHANNNKVNQDEERDTEECPDSDSMTDTVSTGGDDTTATATKNSFSRTIIMNEVDEGEALDRLLYDLSNDEVSMVIDLFGAGYDIGTNEQHATILPPFAHLVSENARHRHNSISVSRPAVLDENFQNDRSKETVVSSTGGIKQPYGPLRIPPSLFQQNYHPAIQHLRFASMDMAVYGGNGMYGAVFNPLSGVVTPTIPGPQEEGNQKLILNHAVSSLRRHVIGGQITKKGSELGVLLPKPVSDLSLQSQQQKKKTNSNKRAHALREVLPKKTTDGVGASSATPVSTKTAKKKTKVAPARRKKNKAKAKQKIATSPEAETYITFPKMMKEDRWNQRVSEAQEFIAKHGHGRIPTTYAPNPDLANWAKRQRNHYKNFKKHFLDRPDNPAVVTTSNPKKPHMRVIKCLMTTQRLEKLREIGVCMDLQGDAWDRMYERLCDYSRRNNGRTCPSKHADFELWKWSGTQRYQMKLRTKIEKGASFKKCMPCLTKERIAKLNQINFVWDRKVSKRLGTGKFGQAGSLAY